MADLGTVARPYARAVFDVAASEQALGAWSSALAAAAAVVADPAARSFLARPDVADDARVAFVADIAKRAGAGEVWGTQRGKNLLAVLAENGRLEALPEIATQFDSLKAQAENKVRVTLTAATAVDDELARRVSAALERKLGRSVELEVAVDEGLVGGAIIRAEDSVIDGSVKSRLQRLAEKLTA